MCSDEVGCAMMCRWAGGNRCEVRVRAYVCVGVRLGWVPTPECLPYAHTRPSGVVRSCQRSQCSFPPRCWPLPRLLSATCTRSCERACVSGCVDARVPHACICVYMRVHMLEIVACSVKPCVIWTGWCTAGASRWQCCVALH